MMGSCKISQVLQSRFFSWLSMSWSRDYFAKPSDIVPFLCKEMFHSKWFEPRSISSSCSVIVRVSVVLKRTVGDSD